MSHSSHVDIKSCYRIMHRTIPHASFNTHFLPTILGSKELTEGSMSCCSMKLRSTLSAPQILDLLLVLHSWARWPVTVVSLQMQCMCCATVWSCCPSTSPVLMSKTRCPRGSLSGTLAEQPIMSRMTLWAISMTTYTWLATWLRSSAHQLSSRILIPHWRTGINDWVPVDLWTVWKQIWMTLLSFKEYNDKWNLNGWLTTVVVKSTTALWERLCHQIVWMLLDSKGGKRLKCP